MSGVDSLLLSDATSPTAPPPVMLGYQQRWIEDDSPLKLGEKSRRIGLTWAEAADDVLQAAVTGGSNVFYIGPTADMALEFIEACAMWARAYDYVASEVEEGLYDDDDKAIKTFKVDFSSGKRIVALSSRPTNLRGKQGIIVIDEAAFHNDLKALLKAAMAMLMWGDKVRILSTHFGDANPFNELVQDVRAKKRKGSVHRITFRDAVAEGLYRRVCLRRGLEWSQEAEDQWVRDTYDYYGDDAPEELDVIPSQGGGVFLPLALIKLRMSADTPVVRGRWEDVFGLQPEYERYGVIERWCEEHLSEPLARLDRNCHHSLAQDFGRVSDLSVITIGEEANNLDTRVRLQVELSNCPFAQQKQVLKYIGDRLPRFRSAALDAGGNGASQAEFAQDEYGADRVESVHLSQQFYLQHMAGFKAALQDGTLRDLPLDSQTSDDLRALRVIEGIPRLPKAKTQRGDGQRLTRHGDAAIALFLLWYAMQREVTEIDFDSDDVVRAGYQLEDFIGG